MPKKLKELLMGHQVYISDLPMENAITAFRVPGGLLYVTQIGAFPDNVCTALAVASTFVPVPSFYFADEL